MPHLPTLLMNRCIDRAGGICQMRQTLQGKEAKSGKRTRARRYPSKLDKTVATIAQMTLCFAAGYRSLRCQGKLRSLFPITRRDPLVPTTPTQHNAILGRYASKQSVASLVRLCDVLRATVLTVSKPTLRRFQTNFKNRTYMIEGFTFTRS